MSSSRAPYRRLDANESEAGAAHPAKRSSLASFLSSRWGRASIAVGAVGLVLLLLSSSRSSRTVGRVEHAATLVEPSPSPSKEEAAEDVSSQVDVDALPSPPSARPRWPDLERYDRRLQTLGSEQLKYKERHGRLIIVGDIHGMKSSLDELLAQLDYDSSRDTLLHAGDVVAKGPLSGSLGVMEYLRTNQIAGVRGNHDQHVIGWKLWFDWVRTLPEGSSWLATFENSDLTSKVKAKPLAGYPFPDNWKWGGQHWKIALKMTNQDLEYLLSLPLALHIPDLHVMLVHAGLLPFDPSSSAVQSEEPLLHVPTTSESLEARRTAQEAAVFTNVRQNQNPWAILNIRSVTNGGEVSKEPDEGVPWADVWNSAMKRCHGSKAASKRADDADSVVEDALQNTKPMPCYPFTVVYGHAAARGLDIKQWSKGLDSGCVYGRKLSALVYSDKDVRFYEEDPESTLSMQSVTLGDLPGQARIASIPCPKP